MRTHVVFLLIAVAGARAQAPPPFSPTAWFQQHCATCHASGGAVRAPSPAALRALTPEAVYAAITTGAMKDKAAGLSDAGRTALAEALTERKLGIAAVADAKAMSNPCASNPPISAGAAPVNGYGVDLANSRFIPPKAAGLTIDRVTNLQLKWAFGFPGVSQMLGQPVVAGDRLFVGAQSGYVYSLDASTGCVYWSFLADAGVRTAPVFGNAGERAALWFGDLKGNAYAIDARTGRPIWKVNLDPHVAARITAAPAMYEGAVYFGVSSFEEVPAADPKYECCTFRGSVAALDANTGRKLWQTYTIAEAPRPTRKNSAGTQLWGPAGGAVWGTPAIDPQHGALYIGTGDAYVGPAAPTTDSIMALDLKTGALLWAVQDLANDAWSLACFDPKSDGCPSPRGPDYDFAAALILRELPDGKRLLLAGQKSGLVWAHDPDRKGAVVWKTDVARSRPNEAGEIVWGGAADDTSVYYGLSSGGVAALDIATGKQKWLAAFNGSGEHAGSPGAVTAIRGVVFSGGLDGLLRALATEDGRIVWDYDTKQTVRTVNGVKASGGSVGAPGPVIANGMVYIESGFVGVVSGAPGNLLLAFSAPAAP
ncbi:MAG: PQQ-binding-like beta-propeller repeat protein [Acidobacteriota bacterium]|nr:PQQ-binding-like beta-propeller repeat protein [Acidobacteriota bacterium]